MGAHPWGVARLRLNCSEVVVKKENLVARGCRNGKRRKGQEDDGDGFSRQVAEEVAASASAIVALAARSAARAAVYDAWAAASSVAQADMAAA